MRITCPNCNAQYEIAEEMIPADGRDVQCSNCGTTWYQEGRSREAVAPAPRAAPQRPSQDDPPSKSEDGPPPDAPRPRRPLTDDQTLDILREERAHEERVREAEVAPPQTQQEDPRQNAAAEAARMSAAASVARARASAGTVPKPAPKPEQDDVADAIAMALREGQIDDEPDEVKPTDTAGSDAVDGVRGGRRNLLPDIEEINSSLRPDERAAEAAALAEADDISEASTNGGGGFRLGFVAVLVLMLLVIALYAFAGPIKGAVPALAGTVDGFVGAIDWLRLRLEAGAESLLELLSPDQA